jgi:molybdate transport system ATP-binding protein
MINIKIKKDNILDVDFSIKNGEFLALFGVSGSGKTTLLRTLSGLESAQATIEVNNEIWQNEKINLAPQKRKIGFVFQDYALFENMSVLQNLYYVKKDKELALRLLKITDLTNLKDRLPKTLSGGQKQRVSLCRAMMNKPKLLLLDEPLSALDSKMREKLQDEILTFHKEFKTTTIMVSHDPSEIYKLSSRVIILQSGKIINDGSPKNVLLQMNGSQKFAFSGKLLDIKKVDVIFIAIVAIGQQLVEIVINKSEINDFKIGQEITISTKAFTPIITPKS